MNNAFTITYLLFGILMMLFAIVVLLMAAPGPKKPDNRRSS